MLERGLSATGGEGHLRELEGKLGRQRDVIVTLQSDDLGHHILCRSIVFVGEKPFHAYQVPVNQNLRRKAGG